MGRGPTAYFVFSDENRASAKAELAEQSGKHGVAQVAKLIGQRWAALSEEEKQVYKNRAARLQEEAAAGMAAEQAEQQQQSPSGGDGDEGAEPQQAPGAAASSSAPAPAPTLPTSIVKRIVLMDSDVKRLSGEGLRAIAKAAELFAGQLAVRAMEQAAKGKRKNFRASDVEYLANRDRRLIDMGLREVLEELAQAAADGDEGGQNGAVDAAHKLTKKQQKDEAAAAGTRQITSFFAAAN